MYLLSKSIYPASLFSCLITQYFCSRVLFLVSSSAVNSLSPMSFHSFSQSSYTATLILLFSPYQRSIFNGFSLRGQTGSAPAPWSVSVHMLCPFGPLITTLGFIFPLKNLGFLNSLPLITLISTAPRYLGPYEDSTIIS